LVPPSDAAAQADFRVIVNSANSVSSLTAKQISDVFLKRLRSWGTGNDVVPVDLPDGSPVRELFSQAIHRKPTSAVLAYWQRQLFSGADVPPVQRTTVQDVTTFVAGNANAVGYVSAETALPPMVKVLRIAVAGTAGDSSAAQTTYRLEQVDERPQPMSVPSVRYPAHLRSRRVEGYVRLSYVVKEDGSVDASSITVMESSHPEFERPAADVVRRSVFRPARLGGRAVAVPVEQTISFELTKQGNPT